jgi:1-deoxy-D-xylulose-5-phosphate synthase
MRLFPNMVVMAPGDESDLEAMLEFALEHDAPTSIRYPKTAAERLQRDAQPIELGVAETIETGRDGTILACGTLLSTCLKAAAQLRQDGLDVGVVNARFIKPLDRDTILRALRETPFVLTVEEAALQGGFGSAVLEAAADAGVSAKHVRRLGVPDRFVEHGERGELLAELGLDMASIVRAAKEMASAHRQGQQSLAARRA